MRALQEGFTAMRVVQGCQATLPPLGVTATMLAARLPLQSHYALYAALVSLQCS
jgi:hypothetical protein